MTGEEKAIYHMLGVGCKEAFAKVGEVKFIDGPYLTLQGGRCKATSFYLCDGLLMLGATKA
jgi:hypothetical protein